MTHPRPERAAPVGQTDIVERLRARFDANWMPEPNSGCWLWIGVTFRGGPYATNIRPRIGDRLAHRVAWELHCGPIPDGLQVLHKCDVPLCVNPDHLFLGTHQDNMDDKVRKGRTKRLWGVTNGTALLSDEIVREIRASTVGNRAWGRRLNVCESTIRFVRKGVTWGHVQ